MASLSTVIVVLNLFVPNSGTNYGEYFIKHGSRYRIDPLLIAAVAYHESLFQPNKVSQTNDYGLMQLHIGRRTHSKYLRRESLLFDPDRNIRLGTKMLAWWRAYHHRSCKREHHWLLHYNQGSQVGKTGWRRRYACRVLKIYHQLLKIKSKVSRNRNATS